MSIHIIHSNLSKTARFTCLLLTLLILYTNNVISQISVDPSNTLELDPESLVKNVFIGSGVRVESIEFKGSNKALGVFRNGLNDIGIDRGIVLSTGEVESLDMSNNDASTGSSTSLRDVTDDQLAAIAKEDLFDVAVIEIKFRPVDDVIGFNFVFGSEEYPEFVCSQFNDVFAFFINGPNPDGGDYVAENIALVPDPADPTGRTYTDFPVTINSVNNGEIGTENLGDCTGPGESLGFSTYFNDNTLSRTFTLDGFLDVFRAQAKVMPCELYTLKLAIGDGFDFDFDSAVFMEAKSFSSTLHTLAVDAPGIDYSLMEGCDIAEIKLRRTENMDESHTVRYQIIDGVDGAVEGVDYNMNISDLSFAPGQEEIILEIEAIEDDLNEVDEKIYFVFQNGDCFNDTIVLTILDHFVPEFTLPQDTVLCEGESFLVQEVDDIDQLQIFEKSGEFVIGDPDLGDCRSNLTVSNLDATYLTEESFFQVCIDFLEHDWLGELEIYLVGPAGQIIELSTNNGEDGGNDSQVDRMINTCFTIGADRLINDGNADEGPYFVDNPTYTGNFLPEQDFDQLFSDPYPQATGRWTLVIRDDEENDFRGTLYQWSLKFRPGYTEERNYTANGAPLGSSSSVITSDVELREIITNNYGCSFENTSKIEFTALPSPPAISCSNPLRNQILLDWPGTDADEYEVKVGNGQWQVVSESNSLLIDDLGLSSTYQITARSVKRGCIGPEETFVCETPPCGVSDIIIDEIIPSVSGCEDDGIALLSVNGSDGPYTFTVEDKSNTTGIFENLALGAYRVYLEDRYGCTFTKIIEIDGVSPFELNISRKKVSCDPDIGGSAWIELDGGLAPYIYRWNNGERTKRIDGLKKGIYSVTVADFAGCVKSATIEVEESDPPSLNFQKEDVECFGQATGSITLVGSDGEGPYEFRWSDGLVTIQNNRDNLQAGIYEVSIVDFNKCVDSRIIEIEQPPIFEVSIDKEDNICNAGLEGIAQLNISGGVTPYEIFWSNGGSDRILRDLKSDDYSVTITDAMGCQLRESITITEPEQLQIEWTETPITCHGGENGALNVRVINGSGNYQYQWTVNGSLQTINNLGIGQYCVSITDEKGCVYDECYTISEPEPIDIKIGTEDITCYQQSDGSISLDIIGGFPPYEVSVNAEPVQSGASVLVDDLRAGKYFVKVVDNVGCIVTKVVDIIEAPEPEITAEVENIECSGEEGGSIFLKYFSEPNAPISWIDDQGNTFEGRYLSNLPSGRYEYTINSSSGCLIEGVVLVDEPDDPLTMTIETNNISCYGDRNGEIVLTGKGGSGSYFYSLDGVGFQRSGIYRGLTEGTYPSFIQDDKGCVYTGDTITITEPQELYVRISSDTVVDRGTDLSISLDVQNAQGEVYYYWDSDPLQELTCEDCINLYVNDVSDDFVLRVEVEDDNFCRAADDIQVFVIKDYKMWVPTGFSPNEDGNNERLNVFGPDFAFVKEFNVFLRNGTNIYNEYNFKPNDIKIGWDGTFREKKMPAGVYIWTMHVEFDDGSYESFKGSVQLIR